MAQWTAIDTGRRGRGTRRFSSGEGAPARGSHGSVGASVSRPRARRSLASRTALHASGTPDSGGDEGTERGIGDDGDEAIIHFPGVSCTCEPFVLNLVGDTVSEEEEDR